MGRPRTWSRQRLLDERVAKLLLETPPGDDEGHRAALQALAAENALVKTVNNEGWTALVEQLQGPPFRTPTTLPPAGGKHMHLFGRVSVSSVGLIWDLSQLDLSGAFIWPSGYNAKSEFNVTEHGILLNGRREALVSVDRLRSDNRNLAYHSEAHGGYESADLLPWNEVLLRLSGPRGLVAIFARTSSVGHLLLAMGVRALLASGLAMDGELPLFVLDATDGARPVGLTFQRLLLHEYVSYVERPILDPPSLPCGMPSLLIDCRNLGIHPLDQLRFHGAHGITASALATLLGTLLRDGWPEAWQAERCTAVEQQQHVDRLDIIMKRIRGLPRARQAFAVLGFGLQASVEANNARSAESLLLAIAPFFSASLESSTRSALSPTAKRSELADDVPSGQSLASCLRGLARKSLSSRLTIVIGATILLDELLSGRMLRHIKEACKELEVWLASSDSLAFRLMSWRKLCQARQFSRQESPSIYAFLTRKAITNRTRFHTELLHLQDSNDLRECLRGVHELVTKLHHPSLRLQTLRYLLGLEDEYDLNSVAGITQLALRAFTSTGAADAESSLHANIQIGHLNDVDISAVSAGWDRSASEP